MPEILPLLSAERVGFVNEQNAANRFLDDFSNFQRRLANVTRDHSRTVGFDQLPATQNAKRFVNARQQARHRRFAGAGIAVEYEMPRHRNDGQTFRLPHLLNLEQVDEIQNVVSSDFDLIENSQNE